MEKFLGKVLDSRYRVDSILEVGGMGTVYEGSHVRLGRKIAIKILHEELIADEVQTERFLREARAAAEIHHRNVVDVLDIGRTKEGLPFFVMELLTGEALKVRMKRMRRIPPPEIGWIAQHALAGLSVAHAEGVIHRDVKPGNIFICREKDGQEIAKILDFGVAKFKFRSEQIHAKELTTTGTILGTPYYMSPEQAMGKKAMVDARSDIYSCGLIVYRGLTGKNPFRGENYNEVIYNILTREIPPPSYLHKALPPEVDEVVLKAVSRDPEDRYQTCSEFIKALEIFQELETVNEVHAGKAEEAGKGVEPEEDIADESMQFLDRGAGADKREEIGAPVPGGDRKETSASLSSAAGGGKRNVYRSYAKALAAILVLAAGFFFVHTYVNRKAESGRTATVVPGSGEGTGQAKERGSVGVRLDLEGVPEGAVVKVNEAVRSGNPIFLERSDVPVSVEVAKEGFERFVAQIVPSHDRRVVVKMRELAVKDGGEEEVQPGGAAPESQEEEVKKASKKKRKRRKGTKKKIYTKLPESK